MLRRILCTACMLAAQIQPRTHVEDHADDTDPTRQHYLDPTNQEPICPERSTDHEVGIGDMCEFWGSKKAWEV